MLTTIPSIFHHSADSLKDIISPPPPLPCSSVPAIPVVDLLSARRREDLVAQVRRAAGTVGFFCLVNHGVPEELMAGVLRGVRQFNEGPVEAKQALYSRDAARSLRFACNLDLFTSAAADWRDTLYCRVLPDPPPPEQLPEPLTMMQDYGKAMAKVARNVLELLSESLGLPGDHLRQMGCMEQLHLVCQYYPPCPEPHLTMGVRSHSDTGFITVLLQDAMGGLQVLIERRCLGHSWSTWAAFFSVMHRVPASKSRDTARVSVAAFFNPDEKRSERLYGPIPDPGKPPMYGSVKFPDFIAKFNSIGLHGRILDHYRLEDDLTSTQHV